MSTMVKSAPSTSSRATLTGRLSAAIKALQVAVGLKKKSWRELNRGQYKSVWNSISTSEEDAKRVVAGLTDEDIIRQSVSLTLAMLQRYVGLARDDVVLEIGAGVGRVGAAVAPLCREWIGTDVSENMVRHMQRRLAALRNVRVIATNGCDLAAIPSGSVDLVYCTVVFPHLDEWDRYGYIAEGFRVLKPGGRMLVDNVNLVSDAGWQMFLQHCAIPPAERPPNISMTSTPQELETYFRRAGYRDVAQADGGHMIIVYGRKPLSE